MHVAMASSPGCGGGAPATCPDPRQAHRARRRAASAVTFWLVVDVIFRHPIADGALAGSCGPWESSASSSPSFGFTATALRGRHQTVRSRNRRVPRCEPPSASSPGRGGSPLAGGINTSFASTPDPASRPGYGWRPRHSTVQCRAPRPGPRHLRGHGTLEETLDTPRRTCLPVVRWSLPTSRLADSVPGTKGLPPREGLSSTCRRPGLGSQCRPPAGLSCSPGSREAWVGLVRARGTL